MLAAEEVAYAGTDPARAARTAPIPDELHPRLRSALDAQGLGSLYEHQAEAWEAAARGEHVVVTTGTASGKTLAFNLPVLDSLARDPKQRALYLYPTKALAQDQLRALGTFALPRLRPEIYDGDTPSEARWRIRRWANVVLTNPDMLHVGVLPHHDRWADVLHNLRWVIIDEAHVYRGVFGSHVGNVLRRLRRLARIYGAEPQFVFASATIANPGELALALAGVGATVVRDDAAPRAERTVVLWNPPLLDAELGRRASALGEASRLMADLVTRGRRTICFAKSRKAAELIHRLTVERVDAETGRRLAPYRAGYTPAQRREIERRLVEGELLGVSATDALELGIDIGSLDAALLVGYPGTRASLWQQAGRAGRRSEGSLAVLVAQDEPLDQYLVTHPEDLFDKPPEAAVIDPTNPYVLVPHLLCAAREQPLSDEEVSTYWPEASDTVPGLEATGELRRRGSLLHHAGHEPPHRTVDIRSTGGRRFQIVIEETGELLGTVDGARAYGQVHPGAVYLHQGEQFEVRELDLSANVAIVTRTDPDYYTQSRDTTDIDVVLEQERRPLSGDTETSFGTVRVTNQVVAYARKHVATGEVLEVVPLELPPVLLETRAAWWGISQAVIDRASIRPSDVPGAAHAAEHAAIGLLPLVATCDRWDVGGVSTAYHPDTGSCTIFVYDGYEGGAGIAERGFTSARRWLEATLETVAGCPCSLGCPSCVQSPKCGNGNEPLDKAGAVSLLEAMLGRRTSKRTTRT